MFWLFASVSLLISFSVIFWVGLYNQETQARQALGLCIPSLLRNCCSQGEVPWEANCGTVTGLCQERRRPQVHNWWEEKKAGVSGGNHHGGISQFYKSSEGKRMFQSDPEFGQETWMFLAPSGTCRPIWELPWEGSVALGKAVAFSWGAGTWQFNLPRNWGEKYFCLASRTYECTHTAPEGGDDRGSRGTLGLWANTISIEVGRGRT